ncbi:hypothetical protein C8J57DRAFT_233279 [Mycena rebaudengoi]|nr:hypothetical protein C8J57DRAFT_233279 [Mycena rebaudengoi]
MIPILPCSNSVPFPLLQELAINDGRLKYGLMDDGLFREAPLLRRLTLKGKNRASPFNIPWRNITTFNRDGFTIASCLDLLRCAPFLRVVECAFSTEGQEVKDRELVSHLCLKSLAVIKCSAHILDSLVLPSLQRLRLDDMNDLEDDLLKSFLSRSNAALRPP